MQIVMLKKWIISTKNDIDKRSALWNMIASILGSGQSAVFLLVVTRICDTAYAGIFSIATTLGYQIVTIGNYGMRNYQATDVKHKYIFGEYLFSRYISSAFMFVFLIAYIGIKEYSMEKALIVFVFGVFKAIDVIEDVFHGEFQRYNRLDIGAICMVIRYLISFIVFTVVLVITKDLLFACVWETVVSIIVFVFLTHEVIKPQRILSIRGAYKGAKSLLIDCFPLFMGGFLYLYICNAPKYAIDSCLSQESQAYFAILFMPVFVVNLLSGFIYRPLLTRMAVCWVEGKNRELSHIIERQIGFITVATIIGMIGSYLVGVNILTLIYGVNVNIYRTCLVILMFGGGFAALTGYLMNVLVIMRLQKKMLLGYCLVALVSIVISNIMVNKFEIIGASMLYVLLMILLAVYFTVIILLYRTKRIKK